MKNKKKHQIGYIKSENIFCLFFMQTFLSRDNFKGSSDSRDYIYWYILIYIYWDTDDLYSLKVKIQCQFTACDAGWSHLDHLNISVINHDFRHLSWLFQTNISAIKKQDNKKDGMAWISKILNFIYILKFKQSP